MSWDIGVFRGDLPAGATNMTEMVSDPLPIGTRAEVHAALAQLLPGYAPEGDWSCWDFAIEIFIHPGDPVTFVSFTPHGNVLLAIEPVFAFAERFGALVVSFSNCELLTRQTAHADWVRFRSYRDRVLPREQPQRS